MSARLLRQWVLVAALLVVLLTAGTWLVLTSMVLGGEAVDGTAGEDPPAAVGGPNDPGADAPRPERGGSAAGAPRAPDVPEAAGSTPPGGAPSSEPGNPSAPADGTSRGTAPDASYVGPGACKMCHLKHEKSWRATGMARAFEALKPGRSVERKRAASLDPSADYTLDAACLRCHTTGYGTTSGYPARPEAGRAWNVAEEERARRFEGVSCEACHGPGSLYGPYKKDHPDYALAEIRRLGATVPAPEAGCETCHQRECPTMPADYVFVAKRARERAEAFHEHWPLKQHHGDR